MLAVIWQDLCAEMENSILLFENSNQMARYIQCEHKLTNHERKIIAERGSVILCTRDDGTYYLAKDADEIHYTEYPRGSVSYTSVCCNDQREWEMC